MIAQWRDSAGALNKMDEESPVQSFVEMSQESLRPVERSTVFTVDLLKLQARCSPQVGNLAKYGRYTIQGGLSNMGYGAMNESF